METLCFGRGDARANVRANGPGKGALFFASLGENIFGCDTAPSTFGVPIDKPLYLKNAIDPTLYLQVEQGSSSFPVGARLMFKPRPENMDSCMWLAKAMSASSFSLQHVQSGCFVECSRCDDDPQGTLHLRSGIPFFGKRCVEFIARKEKESEATPFRLECQSMKDIYHCSVLNQRLFCVDSSLVDWPRVGPGDGRWLIGGVEPVPRSGEDRHREGGHIFLWEEVERNIFVTLQLASREEGQVCTCRNLAGNVVLEHTLSIGDRLGDIRSMVRTQFSKDNIGNTRVVLVTDVGEELMPEDDSKVLADICS